MAVIVVRIARPRGDRPEQVPPAESAIGASSAVTWASLLAVVAGVGLVLASVAGGPPWLRVALIALGAVMGMVGLAELSLEMLADGLPAPAPTARPRPRSAGRPARPPA